MIAQGLWHIEENPIVKPWLVWFQAACSFYDTSWRLNMETVSRDGLTWFQCYICLFQVNWLIYGYFQDHLTHLQSTAGKIQTDEYLSFYQDFILRRETPCHVQCLENTLGGHLSLLCSEVSPGSSLGSGFDGDSEGPQPAGTWWEASCSLSILGYAHL